jgi:hypothetical protein
MPASSVAAAAIATVARLMGAVELLSGTGHGHMSTEAEDFQFGHSPELQKPLWYGPRGMVSVSMPSAADSGNQHTPHTRKGELPATLPQPH